MIVKAVKTHKITLEDKDILNILNKYIKNLREESVVVIVSKIISISEGSVLKLSDKDLDNLIKKQADKYISKEEHKYKLYITLKNNHLTYSSGIDESNGNGYQILWPKDVQKTANKIRSFLKKKFGLKNLGIIITDMTALPLRWGIIAGEIAYSGFNPLKDLTGTPDIFGKKFKYTKVGVLNGLSAAAGVVMGEGAEQTPIGIITDISFVEFVDPNPTKKELDSLIIDPENDLYGPLFKNAPWKKDKT
jgi:dihydrofolate synthase / folylpolyglutamate synthase